MPSGDKSGPSGSGPMTGRAAGYCAGNETAGFENPLPRRGRADRGRRGGRGFLGFRNIGGNPRRGIFSSDYGGDSEVDEAEILKNEADLLKKRLENINERLKKFNKE